MHIVWLSSEMIACGLFWIYFHDALDFLYLKNKTLNVQYLSQKLLNNFQT